jgi:hypothetical protein
MLYRSTIQKLIRPLKMASRWGSEIGGTFP